MPIEALRSLPESLANPIAVFQSRTRSDSLVVLTEHMEKGSPIIIAVHLGKQQGRGLVINEVASVYGKRKSEVAKMFGEIVLYEDRERSSAWARRVGLQLPKRGTPTQNPKGMIPGPEEVVKQWEAGRQPKPPATKRRDK